MSLKVRLLFFWFVSIALILLLVQVCFTTAIDKQNEENVHRLIAQSMKTLKSGLAKSGAELFQACDRLAQSPSIRASTNMVDHYQNSVSYKAIVVDEEKRKLALQLAREAVQPGNCDLAVIYDTKGNLMSYTQFHSGHLERGFLSYAEGKPIWFHAVDQEPFIKQETAPSHITHSSSDVGLNVLHYISCDRGLGIVINKPINKQMPYGSFETVGFLKMVKFVDQDFVTRQAGINRIDLMLISGKQVFAEGLTLLKVGKLPSVSELPDIFNKDHILQVYEVKSAQHHAHVVKISVASGADAVIVLGVEQSIFKQQLSILHSVVLLLLLGIAFFILPLGHYVLNRMLSTPLARLIADVKLMENNGKESIEEMPGVKEFSSLARTINSMSATIQSREREFKQQSALLDSVVNSIPDLIFYKDLQGVYLGCNKAFESFTGYSGQEISGKTDSDLFPQPLAEVFREQDTLIFESGKSRHTEEWGTYPDGHKVLLDTLKTLFVSQDNDVLGLVGVSRDITKIKDTEEKLSNERERLSVTLRSIGDGVITTDTEGTVLFLNKVAENLTGWTDEEARGKPSATVFNIVNEKTGQKCASPVSRVLKLGRIVGLANHTGLISKDGTRISIADSGAPIRDRKSKVIGVVIVFRDVTKEKKIEAELIKIRKLESVGVLAGGIAHDFNNILSAIMGNVELALYRVAKDEKTAELLSDATKATKRAAKLTQQLLTFSKGGDPLKEKTPLVELVQESADFVLHGSRVSCDYKFADNLWTVIADSGQIGQVIQNIAMNAKQAMPEGGTITVSCYNVSDAAAESLLNIHDGTFVCIKIKDSGIGIPAETTDKIFDPYFSTKQEGSGLGLAICHSIINKHGGYISVNSISGQGATFSIYLPAVVSNGYSDKEQQELSKAVKASLIMVMDDDEMVRNVARAQLVRLGHEAVLVVDGTQALNKYQELQDSGRSVDLVIMDLTIPGGMGGQEAVQKLLQIDPDAKIIVASGYSNDPIMANYLDYGFCAAVAKPFDLNELNSAIASAI